ncbi:hypothetical protein BST28_18630 [Mycolicibacter kumamotonensis]|uniref:Uncharacterized protein n=1 Tax=Mycolicibacter kumamotonensis TaxID=354243 RepID=A0A1X0DYF3_9MYCO|nr:hypothetical protein [Mycolicibacter kumamotonensis]ORA77282.1 hypothetical protein BST28_18630 [Mycolicibacter kumamotonensis]
MSDKAIEVIHRRVLKAECDPGDAPWTIAVDILSALKAAGFAVVELPKPTATYDHMAEEPMMGWEVEAGPYFVRTLRHEVQVSYDGEPDEPFDPTGARVFAAALLAAANAAEAAREVGAE